MVGSVLVLVEKVPGNWHIEGQCIMKVPTVMGGKKPNALFVKDGKMSGKSGRLM